jgi:hypothetical protein
VTPQSIATVESIVMENRRVTVNDTATLKDISHGSPHHIINDVFQSHKVSAKRAPRQLTPEFKRRADACQQILRRFEAGDGFLTRIVTGDETWVRYHQPETRTASKEWRHPSPPKPKKFRTQPSAGTVMLTLFWDERGVIFQQYMPRGNTSATYRELLGNHFGPQSNPNNVGLSTGVLLQHDNVGRILPAQRLQPSRTCTSSVFHIRRTRQTSPPVITTSSDHSKSRWGKTLSGPMKRCNKWCMSGCARDQNTFFTRRIHAFCKSWRTCIERNGDYVKKNGTVVCHFCSIIYEKNI